MPDWNILHQRWDEEIGDEKREAEVDDDDPDEVHQVGLLALRKQEHHQEGAHCRRNRGEDGREDSPVAVTAVMVNHHNRRVDDDSQRDSDSRKGVDMDLKPGERIYRQSREDVHRESGEDDQHISPRAVNDEYEQQENQHAEACPEIDPVQLTLDIFRRIVRDRGRDLPGEAAPQLIHLRPHRRGCGQQVGRGGYLRRHGDGVQAVHPVVVGGK